MKKLVLLPLALAFAANAAMAANSVDLRVVGTITPPACDISIVGGGDFAFGDISASTLNQTSSTPITPITKDLSVVCSAATLVGLKAIDNQPVPGDGDGYGIGVDGAGNKIGHYNIQLGTVSLDSVPGVLLRSTDAGATWGALPNPPYLNNTTDRVTSWSTGSVSNPSPVSSVSLPLTVKLFIADPNTFDSSVEQTIAGSATIELVYL